MNNNAIEHIDRYGVKYVGDKLIKCPQDYEGNYVVEDGTRTIGFSAFFGCSKLLSVIIPKSVIRIDNYAFENCTGMTSVDFSEGLLSIGLYSFGNCCSLKRLKLPDSLVSISMCAFKKCAKLKNIYIGKKMSFIDLGAFDNCPKISSIYWNVEQFKPNSFYWGKIASQITTFTFGENVTQVIGDICARMSRLQEVTIPQRVTCIGENAFSNCTSLTNIVIPPNVTKIGKYAFYNCRNLVNIILPDSIEQIDDGAFAECVRLNFFTQIPQSVVKWGKNVFNHVRYLEIKPSQKIREDYAYAIYDDYGDRGVIRVWIDKYGVIYTEDKKLLCECPSDLLGHYDIPEGVTDIGFSGNQGGLIICTNEPCFSPCKNLISVYFPSTLKNINGRFCPLESILVSEDNPWFKSIDGVLFSKDGTELIMYPQNKQDNSYRIPDGVIDVHDDAICNNIYLRRLIVPSSVSSITSGVRCPNLTNICVESANLKYDSRNKCNAIIETESNILILGCANTIIPLDVLEIGDYAFAYNKLLKYIVIPDNVQRIGRGAFRGTSIEFVKLSNGIKQIKEYTFEGCTELYKLAIPEGIEKIEYNVFENCSKLTHLYLPSSLIEIGHSAFKSCSSLQCILIPNKIKRIKGYTFCGCSSLKYICFSGKDLEQFETGNHAIDECERLKLLISYTRPINGAIKRDQQVCSDIFRYINEETVGKCVNEVRNTNFGISNDTILEIKYNTNKSLALDLGDASINTYVASLLMEKAIRTKINILFVTYLLQVATYKKDNQAYSLLNEVLPILCRILDTEKETELLKYPPLLKEGEKGLIENVLRDNGINCFYHFTSRLNIDSIKKHGGLFSWQYLQRHDIAIPLQGGNELSMDLDKKNNLQDYVRLSFCNDHPMAHRLRTEQETDDIVLLKISTEVAAYEDTLFADMNATDNGHHIGGSIEDLKMIHFDAVKAQYVSRDSDFFKCHQAEVLVKTHIPLKYILNIDEFI